MITPKSSENAAVIVDLHQQIVSSARKSLELAIQIGKLLQIEKRQVQHGQWGNWIRTKMPFTQRTANNYIRLHQMRDQIKLENVSNLAEAYGLLTGPALMDRYEAKRSSAQIQEALHEMVATVVPFVGELRTARERGAFRYEYPTFEAFLFDRTLTLEEFQAQERLSDALVAWTVGDSADAVFKCLSLQQSPTATMRDEDG